MKKKTSTVNREETTMKDIIITIGKQNFTAKLEDNDTAKELVSRLPLTISLSDLNRNEKYTYMDKSLPAKASVVSKIHAGDIMLFGTDCIVFFYKDFSTSYSYTSIGKVDDVSGFVKALGSGNVKMSIKQK